MRQLIIWKFWKKNSSKLGCFGIPNLFLIVSRAEIGKNHKILHEIFPSKIARILVQNIKVDAEHFENATCLYSDIVSFTAMCSSLKPIDIIRLLNK